VETPALRPTPRKELVLVGAGHAHVQVLRRWMMKPLPDVHVSLVVDRPEALYSGMVTGLVAGAYAAHELMIDAVPLARRAGARVILAAATRVDPRERTIELEGRPPVAYDVASLDVGSTVRGLDRPGVREHALATRPLAALIEALEARLDEARAAGRVRVAIVGGGAAGVELACCVDARLAREGLDRTVRLVCQSDEILPGRGPRVVARLRRELDARSVAVDCGVRVEAVEKGAVVTAGGGRIGADLVFWATGAAAPALVRLSPVPSDEEGWVLVGDTFEVAGFQHLFAVGDCASIIGHPWVPRAGVYAVRAGPVLDANLRAALRGRPLRRFRPQRDFLSLLTLGEDTAFGTKWGLTASGPAVWKLKDRIDRRFMARFQVLGPDGAPAAGFPDPASMGMAPMECGGCAAKVETTALSRALGRLGAPLDDGSVRLGLARPDDAAAFETPSGDVELATIDGFRAFTDDAWLVGKVAAVNAVSDVFAKGGRPRHALAVVTLPLEGSAQAEETLYQVLAGVRAALDPLGVALVGGHSTAGPELFVGLTILGDLGRAEGWLPLDGASPGDRLLLTKPLGTGVLLAADMQGLARGRWVESLHASLLRTNAAAARVARDAGATACTDVSGFGLAGHLVEILEASGAAARLRPDAVPLLDGAAGLAERGVFSTFHLQNARSMRPRVAATGPNAELLFDPQTSGGLLMTVPPERADAAVASLRREGDERAAEIGEVVAWDGSATRITVEAGG
jgi:selenide,water dikinase